MKRCIPIIKVMGTFYSFLMWDNIGVLHKFYWWSLFCCQAIKIENADDQWVLDCRDAQSAWAGLMPESFAHGRSEGCCCHSGNPSLVWHECTYPFFNTCGLEQFSGAAWGTRDIAQGPFDLLLCMGKYDEARQILRIIFSNQNVDGGCLNGGCSTVIQTSGPIAPMEISFTGVLLLSVINIKVTGDLKILDEILPYYHENGLKMAEKTPLSEHIDRLIRMIINSFIPGTALVPFGGGDWMILFSRSAKNWRNAWSQVGRLRWLPGLFPMPGGVWADWPTQKKPKNEAICEMIKAISTAILYGME